MKTYSTISNILRDASKSKDYLVEKKAVLDSTAKTPKPQVHIYGKKKVAIGKSPERQSYVVGVMEHKHHTTFYSMAVYAFPKEFSLSPEMKKNLKGKSCFHIKELTPEIEKEVKSITKKSISLFKKQGWV